MHADLWTFSLETYAKPGIETACLSLQAGGANVCLLLCAGWLGVRGVNYSQARLQALQALAQPWQNDVLRPLRALRTQWREPAQHDSELKILREQVKGLELEAERQLLLRLEQLSQDWPLEIAEDLPAWLEGSAASAAQLDHDALQVLRVGFSQAS